MTNSIRCLGRTLSIVCFEKRESKASKGFSCLSTCAVIEVGGRGHAASKLRPKAGPERLRGVCGRRAPRARVCVLCHASLVLGSAARARSPARQSPTHTSRGCLIRQAKRLAARSRAAPRPGCPACVAPIAPSCSAQSAPTRPDTVSCVP